MAKYLTEFDTYAQYSGATLSLPNVSLIKSTGEVYYKNVFAGDTLGDVLMYDIANDRLISSLGGNWSAEAFPIASYTPIAINVYPASQTPDGKNRYMAIRWADSTNSAGNTYNVMRCWGPGSTVLGDITSTSTTDFNGRSNQDKAELLIPGTTGNTQAEYPAFYACSIFAPQGTSAGDWYLPSYKELDLYRQNYSTINSIIQSIKTADYNIVSTVSEDMWTSTEYSSTYSSYELTSSGFKSGSRSANDSVRAMISI